MENVKKEDVWVVTGEVIPKGDLAERRVYGGIYRDFDSAKEGYRGLIRRLSDEEDIRGKLREGLDEWGMGEKDLDDDPDQMYAVQETAKQLAEAILEGQDLTEKAERWQDLWGTNYMYEFSVTIGAEPEFRIRGSWDGPANGIDPVFYTNALAMMTPTKHYFCIVEPCFMHGSHAEAPSRVTVDLLKMEV